MALKNDLTWRIYRNGEQFIVGPVEWQTCTSMTFGIVDFYSDEITEKDFPTILRRARCTPLERCFDLKKKWDTWNRFEVSCEQGNFGAPW